MDDVHFNHRAALVEVCSSSPRRANERSR
jgi:hypothetical protein